MSCTRYDELRDYALGELPGAELGRMETHIAGCHFCADELKRLQMTTAALRMLPDRDAPQRIAFISDKVFAPSAAARFFGVFWNSASRLGFASACLLAAAITFHASRQPTEMRTAVQTAAAPAVYSASEVEAEVRKAVEKVRTEVRLEDANRSKLALAAVERKYEQKQRALMVSVQENFEVMQKRLSSYSMLAYTDASRDTTRLVGQ